ncbi:MAG: flagellar basal body L-ring protein FlgH, partial [Desulfobulbaceae bacterium]|nr:flagellar basal body L-ring protein FlgH [Desulfobulbaceae bacterium]
VRPSDISEDNSILSSYIADARIEYSGVGLISAKQHPGWITGILDVVWPF